MIQPFHQAVDQLAVIVIPCGAQFHYFEKMLFQVADRQSRYLAASPSSKLSLLCTLLSCSSHFLEDALNVFQLVWPEVKRMPLRAVIRRQHLELLQMCLLLSPFLQKLELFRGGFDLLDRFLTTCTPLCRHLSLGFSFINCSIQLISFAKLSPASVE